MVFALFYIVNIPSSELHAPKSKLHCNCFCFFKFYFMRSTLVSCITAYTN
uniref:Uncharacterized protein n=1 Tax=Anguilla anguilla TaxID=7936 RepID=A0A0E9PY60_ANGAN